MKKYKVVLIDPAKQDIKIARDYYKEISPDLSKQFF